MTEPNSYCEHGWVLVCGKDGMGHSIHYNRFMDNGHEIPDDTTALEILERIVELEDSDIDPGVARVWKSRWKRALCCARQYIQAAKSRAR